MNILWREVVFKYSVYLIFCRVSIVMPLLTTFSKLWYVKPMKNLWVSSFAMFGIAYLIIALVWSRLDITEAEHLKAAQDRNQVRLMKQVDRYKLQVDELIARITAQRESVSALENEIFHLKTVSLPDPVEGSAAALEDENDKLVEINTELEEKVARLQLQLKKLHSLFAVTATIHYFRPDAAYRDWGVHTTGRAVPISTPWTQPIAFHERDEYGAIAKIELHLDHKQHPFEFLIHNGPVLDSDPAPELGAVNSGKKVFRFDMATQQNIWIVSGVPNIFTSQEAALAEIKHKNYPHPLLTSD